jgi:hypothetical protein
MSDASSKDTGDTVTNKAESSHVQAQIGVVHGDVSFYKIVSEGNAGGKVPSWS